MINFHVELSIYREKKSDIDVEDMGEFNTSMGVSV